jgi:hypothetical protein
MATPVPFWLLLPGIIAGAFMPGSRFNPEGDEHSRSPLSALAVYAVDVALYGGLANLPLYLGCRIILSRK